MHLIRCKPNGSCFYIAARLGIEVCEILKRVDAGEEKPSTTCLDGFSHIVTESAEDLRKLICEWYHRGLDAVVPQLGYQDESTKKSFTRGDLLALEVIRKGHDVAEKGPDRLQAIRNILDEMRRERSWASTPEYIALSTLTKCKVEVYNYSPSRMLVVRDTALPDADANVFKGTIKLLFENSHQDLLVNADEIAKMATWFPEVKNLPLAQGLGALSPVATPAGSEKPKQSATQSLAAFRPMVQTHGMSDLHGMPRLEAADSPV